MLALHVLQESHYACPDAQNRFAECQSLYQQLDSKAKARWGTNDPFKGSW
jgi:hypothetical protein